ncbi:phosphoribosyltransferase domain-containing protein [Frondihabitans cladoniiphilus]|uniref:Phosphoribosyltransferase n=1 Tax=Frondihabitans cladoniiphilus TaxID=715785 RepID=A0ABP8W7D9_9MICO
MTPSTRDTSTPDTSTSDTTDHDSTGVVWSGAWVRDRLGITLTSDDSAGLIPLEALVGLALRRNPRRAHLLVSTVLAKHVPTVPELARAAGELLGLLTAERLEGGALPSGSGGAEGTTGAAGCSVRVAALGRELAALLSVEEPTRGAVARLRGRLDEVRGVHPTVTVLGYAETATGLGRLVADALGSPYLHSTRHAAPGMPEFGRFEEEHSHATGHRLLPTDATWIRPGGTIVLVDDELSTGRTVLNTIRELQALVPQERWVVSALVDLRDDSDRQAFDEVAAELGVSLEVVALGVGRVTLPADVLSLADELIAELPGPASAGEASTALSAGGVEAGVVDFLDLSDEVDEIRSDRFGNPAGVFDDAAAEIARQLDVPDDGTALLVLGTEEFMALPLAVAERFPGDGVRFSTTTRSPIAAVDSPGYAIRSEIAFASHDAVVDGPGTRHAYNLTPDGRRFARILLFPEPGTETDAVTGPGSLTEALARVADRVTVVLLPADEPERLPEPLRGPDFGSYEPSDVLWLLQDLGDVALEAPAAEREAAIQSGTANYAESLPVEYVPSAEYQELYASALDRSARRVAEAVGVVTELCLDARDGAPVLVSLARAGTPIGVLMRRWAQQVHGIDLPHHTMSIVRGVGIDTTALRWLAAHYDPARVVFVDGWTGKGAIARELAAALAKHADEEGARFGADLAVLADPGHCVTTFGTRDDYLIPSACLNSTVSGLVSRTVYSRALIGPGEFHGAKFYRELQGSDVSRDFIEAVAGQFDEVRDGVASIAAMRRSAPPSATTWAGWAAVESIAAEYGIDDVNLVKPGVGETTRVLLRRVPWKVLVRPDARDDVAHVLLLAEQRGVEVVEVPDLPYSCVGLIHPVGAPGATGPTGAL